MIYRNGEREGERKGNVGHVKRIREFVVAQIKLIYLRFP